MQIISGISGIFSDCNNIFYDKNRTIFTQKFYFQNFSWFQYFVYKLCMLMCIGISPKTSVSNKFSDTRIYRKIALISPCLISAQFLWGNVFKGRAINKCKKTNKQTNKQTNKNKETNFDIFESAFYLISGRMPLTFFSYFRQMLHVFLHFSYK